MLVVESPEDVIRGELGSTERLLWAGRARQGFVLRATDWFFVPFSLMWGGFAIFWEAMAVAMGAPWFFVLWGIPFVLIGLYLILGRFWVDARQRAATAYAITSERVIIVSGLFSRTVKSLNIDTLTDISLSEHSDGGGIITFGSVPFMYAWYAGAAWPGLGQQLVPTMNVPAEARNVYQMIRDTQRAAKHRVE